MPGIYTMEVFAEGYQPREVQFAIVEQNPTLLNITLFNEDTHRIGKLSTNQNSSKGQFLMENRRVFFRPVLEMK